MEINILSHVIIFLEWLKNPPSDLEYDKLKG